MTYGSLFAGVGGLDLGFDAAGLECKWQVEKDERCTSILERHWPNVTRYGDIVDINGYDIEPVDIITFGFPCQDVSNAGVYGDTRQGFKGQRSVLFFEAARIIREMREATDGIYPRYAVAENVVGLLSAEHGQSFLRVLESMVGLGAMAIEWRILDAQNFGLSQRRRRVFLIADFHAGGESAPTIYPQPKSLRRHHETNSKPQRPDPGTTLGDPPAPSIFVSTGYGKYGEGTIAPSLVASTHERESTLIAVDNLRPETGGTHQLRRLSPLECERLMGWPEGHCATLADGRAVKDTPRLRMIGNGIAAPVAQWVASQIIKHNKATIGMQTGP